MVAFCYYIEAFVYQSNQFITNLLTDEKAKEADNHHLLDEMHKLLMHHKGKVEKYGIEMNDDNTLNFLKNNNLEKMPDLNDLQSFGSHVLRKLNSISLDPMEYVARAICAYSNPATAYINPYVTSIYSGMLFNSYC